MDAPYYTGPDEREFNSPPEERADERCPDCGAHGDAPCEPGCGCRDCRRRARRAGDTTPEVAA